MIRDVGDQMTLRTVLYDATGVLNNTATPALLVTKPDGSTIAPAVTNTGSGGLYTASVTPDQAGLWIYRFTFSGSVVTVQGDQFTVVTAGRALVASTEEFKAQLRRTDTADDQALRSYLVSATDWLENTIGGPLSVQTFTESQALSGWWITPFNRPLVSVTSLTPELGSLVDPSAYVVDTDRNAIRIKWGALSGWYTLVYRAGLTVMPERFKVAGLMVAQHLWRVENGGGGLPYPGDAEQTYIPTSLGFAVPARAIELIGTQDIIPGIA